MRAIYLCGPTVYDKAHIGNIRPILSFDIFLRAHRLLGNDFMFIHNITDIDDKIIEKAQQESVSPQAIGEKYTKHYLKLLTLFNIKLPPSSLLPKVTDHIEVIIDFIKQLVAKKFAYVKNDNVWFDVTKAHNYGDVSHQKLSALHYEHNLDKNHPADFALWKKVPIGWSFDSPWGKGRPGWHTECATFVNQITGGKQLFIHGGGIDLIFPHHENENAQYEVLNKRAITERWVHIGHLSVNKQKMSKSLGNMIDGQDFINTYGADTLRMMFLMTSPFSPLEINDSLIANAQILTLKFKKVFLQSQLHDGHQTDKKVIINIASKISQWQFGSALKDVLHQVKSFHQSFKNGALIINIMTLLGFGFTSLIVSQEEKDMYLKWHQLRAQKQFVQADALRKILQNKELI